MVILRLVRSLGQTYAMRNKGRSLEEIRELHRGFLVKCTGVAREATPERVSLLRIVTGALSRSTARFSARVWAFFSF